MKKTLKKQGKWTLDGSRVKGITLDRERQQIAQHFCKMAMSFPRKLLVNSQTYF